MCGAGRDMRGNGEVIPYSYYTGGGAVPIPITGGGAISITGGGAVSITCSCRKGTLRNLCKCMSPKPFFMEHSAYLMSAAPSGLEQGEREGCCHSLIQRGEGTNSNPTLYMLAAVLRSPLIC